MNSSADPRRPDRVIRYSNPLLAQQNAQAQSGGQSNASGDDLTPDYMNVLGMVFSMCALMMRMKWCAWIALYCSCISFANTKVGNNKCNQTVNGRTFIIMSHHL
jgi:hypothetical protein